MPKKESELTEEEKRAINYALGHPVMADLDEKVIKVRRDLMIFSFITFIFCHIHSELEITGVTFLGLQINGKSDDGQKQIIDIVIASLTIVTSYKLFYFLIHCFEYYQRYKIRLSGTFYYRVARQSHFTHEYGHNELMPEDEPYTPTLYKWWIENKDTLESDLKKYASLIKEAEKTPLNSHNYNENLMFIKKNQDKIFQTLNIISYSLKRFDNGFKNFEHNQVLRIGMIEILLPIFLGFFSIFMSFKMFLNT